MLVSGTVLLREARSKNKCIPQFNINNLEWTKIILEKCNELNYPVILGASEGAIKYMGGYKTVTNIVKGLIDDLDVKIPIILHLDHGTSIESCIKAIDSGFTSVMIDASKYNLEDNIKITKEVVNYAHQKGAIVEGELGYVGGSEDNIANEIKYTNIEDAFKYVKETNIDLFAPAIGNAHGIYKGKPNLDLDLLAELNKKVNVPLVLHGGSGIYDNQIVELIRGGITKININTELQIAWSKGVRLYLDNNKDVYDPRKIILSGKEEMISVIKSKIKLFNNI
ncbi:MAG: class II fructose-1,6-bisphosphate aldolase [Bacilli bacterium]|nr:class II fructose-1,6-bisphosphate aldolase [Bacilli bacterium]